MGCFNGCGGYNKFKTSKKDKKSKVTKCTVSIHVNSVHHSSRNIRGLTDACTKSFQGALSGGRRLLPEMPAQRKIGLEELQQCFGLPEKEVSKRLGICLTSLKKVCRGNGIVRWPYRKVQNHNTILIAIYKNL
jgi:hypothetical protein